MTRFIEERGESMPTPLSSPDILQQAYARLWNGRRRLLPLSGMLFAVFGVTGLARGLFPGLYTFNPADLGWLLLPEALALGPLVALLHHRLMEGGGDFAWSMENRLLKFAKAVMYYYVLALFFLLGTFAATQVVPALAGFVLGPMVGGLYPVLVGVTFVGFFMVYARLLLVYAYLAGEAREPLIHSMLVTRGKARQIVSCLLLLAAPVLIPWVGATAYGGDWLNPSLGPGIQIVPILTRSLLLTVGALLLSSGLCVMQEALVAAEESGDVDQDA